MQRQMMRKMQKQMQKSLEKMQEDLNNQVAEGTAGGGAVKIQLNGHHEVISVKISPEVVDPEEIDVLEDLITVAFRDAESKIQEKQAEAMSQLTGGLNLPPGLLGL
jgi:nucleoid-associated protein EbfC